MKIVFRLFALAVFILASSAKSYADPAPASFVADLTSDYLNGNWDAVDASLKAHAKEIVALPAEQKADVKVISTAFAECRQPWWTLCKAGKKINFHPNVWSHRLDATFDPKGNGVQMTQLGDQMHFDLSWNVADMDSTARGEHGFTKGEIGELGVWMTMGSADTWNIVPILSLQNATDEMKNAVTRFEDFRSCVTGAYYGSPRARRWALFLYLNTYLPKYDAMLIQISRKAVGAMFIEELLANPAKYPSIKLPTKAADDKSEERCAEEIKGWIEKHPWTLHEDQSIREALKQFATANAGTAWKSVSAVLPNKLTVALDPEKDKAISPKRDAWIRDQIQKNQPSR